MCDITLFLKCRDIHGLPFHTQLATRSVCSASVLSMFCSAMQATLKWPHWNVHFEMFTAVHSADKGNAVDYASRAAIVSLLGWTAALLQSKPVSAGYRNSLLSGPCSAQYGLRWIESISWRWGPGSRWDRLLASYVTPTRWSRAFIYKALEDAQH